VEHHYEQRYLPQKEPSDASSAQAGKTPGSDAPRIFEQFPPNDLLDRRCGSGQLDFLRIADACPGVSRKANELPKASTKAWIFVLNPPRLRPMA
jgi:hypothetical protein